MKSAGNRLKGALFGIVAVASAVVTYPSVSQAARFRQYPGAICTFQGPPAPADPNQYNWPLYGVWYGVAHSNIVAPTADSLYPNTLTAPLSCPIVEDESVYAKGGTTVYATFDQHTDTWASSFEACATFDSATGETCSSYKDTDSTGVKSYAVTPASTVWQDGRNYGYVYVLLGSRKSYSAKGNDFKGFWVWHP